MSARLRSAVLTCIIFTGTALTAASVAGGSTGQQLGYVFPSSVLKASAAPGSTWTPEPAKYSIGKVLDQPVTMTDGTVLRADVYYPTDSSGKQAAGTFPVVMTQTPYGKGLLGATPGSLGDQTGVQAYLVTRGYIDVVVDVRGTGDSGGEFDLFEPKQQTDGVTLVNWAAKRPGSNGKVGLYGASYLGIDQLLTAGAMPKNSPLKAIFPVVPGNDLYQDTLAMGGLIDYEFSAFYLALTAGLNVAGPVIEGLENLSVLPANLPVLIEHLKDLNDYDAKILVNVLSGGDQTFDEAYWQARNPVNVLNKVVANNIPAYMVGGEYDLFQRGEPLNFSGLQNAWAGRPVTAPMLPNQPLTGRYQLIDGPFNHLTGSTASVDQLQLEWFDTWLKGVNTGMDRTPTPLHYYDLGTGQWTEHGQYPFPGATPTRFYLNNARSSSSSLSLLNHTLTTTKPTKAASDLLLWTLLSNPCGRPTDQWSAGALSTVSGYVLPNAPCINNDLLGSLGIDRATYTTAPLKTAKTIAGPITASIYATSTTSETEFVAQVEDVAPDGTSTPLSEGALIGSQRALTSAQTWLTSDGQILKPGHAYTRAAAVPVTPGKVTRYDIEIFPTYATIKAGHSIRVTISTGDVPHLGPTLPQLLKLLGGAYTVQMSPTAPSAIEMELLPAS